MATWYLDSVAGNNANSGATTSLPKKNFSSLSGLTAAGDIVRAKYNAGVPYTHAVASSSTIGTTLFVTNWVTDTQMFEWEVTRGTVISPSPVFSGFCSFSNMALTGIYAAATNAIWGNANTASCVYRNCYFNLRSSAAANTRLVPFSTLVTTYMENCVFDGQAKTGNAYTVGISPGSSAAGSSFRGNHFTNIKISTGLNGSFLNAVSSNITFMNNYFDGSFIITSGVTQSAIISIKNGSISNICKNSFAIAGSGGGLQSMIMFSDATAILGQITDNIYYTTNTSYTGNYLYQTPSSSTVVNPDANMVGNNAANNLTATSYQIVNFTETYGTSFVITSNPFKSLVNTSPDFLKLDTTIAAGLALVDKGYFDSYSNIGADGSHVAGGASPNAYDLRAGVTVGAVTGTLIIPAIIDVRSGINYDAAPNAKTGVLNLPIEADVRNGITYDNAAKTGTYLAYPLLNLDQVKIGVDRGDGSVGTYTAIERYSDLDLTQIVNGYAYRYNSLTNNRTGTRTSVYALLPLNKVAIGYDRGDTQLGTYDAVERYSDLVLSNVKDSYNFRYNSLVDNRTGTHVELVSTDPGESNVRDGINYIINDANKTGSYVAYPLLPADRVQFNYDRGNGTFGTDKGELFNDVLIASDLAIGVSKLNLNETIVGDYTASERYTQLPESSVEDDVDYLYNNVLFTGTFQGAGATDYPVEENVLYPTQYAFGTKTGKLGFYNDTNINVIKELQANAELVMKNILGSDFEPIRYFKDVALNDFYNNTKKYGIRPMEIDQLRDVIGKDTNDCYYEIKLTTDFNNRDGDDFEREAELYLIEKMTAIRLQLKASKFGFDQRVRIVRDFRIDDCERIGDRVVLCRAVILVSFAT